MPADPLREALAELVRLKDGPRDEAYRAAKDAAWDRARAALAALQQGDSPEPVGCPKTRWDGPYSYRCGLGGANVVGECSLHGPYDNRESPGNPGPLTPELLEPLYEAGACSCVWDMAGDEDAIVKSDPNCPLHSLLRALASTRGYS